MTGISNITTRRTRRVIATLFLSFFVQAILVAGAGAADPSWVRKAKAQFENDEYETVIEIAEPHRKENIGAMFLAMSHLQEHVFNGTQYDREKFKNYKLYLDAKLGADDIYDLLYFVNLDDKPEVVKEARRLASSTFENIQQIEEIPKLVKFLGTNDEKSRRSALSSIKRILEPKRKYVKNGGTLRTKDIRVMSSPKLIAPLLELVPTEKSARQSLVLIEEPVLALLGKHSGPEYIKLEQDVEKAMMKRTKEYPDSNWYSAVGKVRK